MGFFSNIFKPKIKDKYIIVHYVFVSNLKDQLSAERLKHLEEINQLIGGVDKGMDRETEGAQDAPRPVDDVNSRTTASFGYEGEAPAIAKSRTIYTTEILKSDLLVHGEKTDVEIYLELYKQRHALNLDSYGDVIKEIFIPARHSARIEIYKF